MELVGTFILAGTYDGQVLGWLFEKEGNTWQLLPRITAHAHEQSVRAISVANEILISGSADETIKVFNLDKRIEEGTLLQHEGGITCLEYYKDTHFLSGSLDGNICIWNSPKFQCLQILKAHKSGVISLSIHPSGKLALSVSKDSLKLWNLIYGKCAYTTKLEQEPSKILWSPNGENYAILYTNCVEVFSTEKKTHSLKNTRKLVSLTFITDSILAVGGEDKQIQIWNLTTPSQVHQFLAHETRVKDLKVLPNSNHLVSCSSDGSVKVWNVEDLSHPQLLASGKTHARITCLACTTLTDIQNQKNNEVDVEDE